MPQIVRNFLYGIRALRRSPAFACSAILALALGIGGNVAVFSVVRTVLLRPLPYREPEQIVRIFETNIARNVPEMNVAAGNFVDFRARSRAFRGIAASRYLVRGLTRPEGAVTVSVQAVSAGFFDVLGARAALGRSFLAEEDVPGARVVALSDAGWRRLFHADPGIVGKIVPLDGEAHTVVGVMAPETESPSGTDLWLPLALDPEEIGSRTGHNLSVVGRLRAGVTVEQAQADLQSIAGALAVENPITNSDWSARAVPFQEELVREVRPVLLLLLGAVTFVLLIACTNVANLLLVRASGRQREVAVRIAMGATRGQILGQLLVESLILSMAGALGGLLLAYWSVRVMALALPYLLPRMDGFAFDAPVIAFTLGLAMITALLFGLIPALQLAASDLQGSLRDGGRGASTGRGKQHLRAGLVAVEVALSLVLLISTGLLLRSLLALYSADPGFRDKNILTMYTSLPPNRYGEDPKVAIFYREVLRRIRTIPGVENAGGVTALPMTAANYMVRLQVVGAPPVPMGQRPPARYDTITPGYLETMGIPLKAGRVFDDRDTIDKPPVALISETMAKRYFQGQDPIGQKIEINVGTGGPREIVGVVGDIKHQSLDEGPRAAIYDAAYQIPFPLLWIAVRGRNVESLEPAIRRQFASVDKDQPVDRVRTMEAVIADSVFARRFAGYVVGAFAILAAVLAAIGIYGVIAYTVEQRRTEIGIRLAIGASHRRVVAMLLWEGTSMAIAGSLIGIGLSLAATRLIGKLLYGVQPADPITYAVAVVALLVIATVATYVPARRASRIDPAIALRNE
ncbi:MAG: ABC transporter permease [Bryobacteraceae bacterium]